MKTVQQKYTLPHSLLFKIEAQDLCTTSQMEIPSCELFQDLVLEVIDECLFSLGESVKQAIYFHLDKSFAIKRFEIPTKIEEFVAAIENIFGEGARFIEIDIMKQLYARLGHPLEDYAREDELVFLEFVKAFAHTWRIGPNCGFKRQ